MSIIRYRMTGGRLAAVEFRERRSDGLGFIFNGITDGVLTVGDARAAVSGGECTVPLLNIKDGTVIPTLISDGRRISLDGFEKRGRIIKPLPLSDAEVRALLEQCSSLEERLTSAERLLKRLSSKIESSTIF